MTRATARTREIASAALSSDLPDSAIAARYGISRSRVRAIRKAAGGAARLPGRRKGAAAQSELALKRALGECCAALASALDDSDVFGDGQAKQIEEQLVRWTEMAKIL